MIFFYTLYFTCFTKIQILISTNTLTFLITYLIFLVFLFTILHPVKNNPARKGRPANVREDSVDKGEWRRKTRAGRNSGGLACSCFGTRKYVE